MLKLEVYNEGEKIFGALWHRSIPCHFISQNTHSSESVFYYYMWSYFNFDEKNTFLNVAINCVVFSMHDILWWKLPNWSRPGIAAVQFVSSSCCAQSEQSITEFNGSNWRQIIRANSSPVLIEIWAVHPNNGWPKLCAATVGHNSSQPVPIWSGP